MAERIDDLQCNGYRIIQDSEGFCFGMDAVLLANFAVPAVTSETRLLDLCSGTGIVPLLIAAKTGCGAAPHLLSRRQPLGRGYAAKAP